jgi:hypothetical protein
MSDPKCSYKFTFEPGWFVDYPVISHSCPGSKLTTQPNLGLLDDRAWAKLTEHVERLNHEDDSDVQHKILLVARHGHGVHNDVMEEVGSEEWKVSVFPYVEHDSSKLIILRITGRNYLGMQTELGLTPNLLRKESNKPKTSGSCILRAFGKQTFPSPILSIPARSLEALKQQASYSETLSPNRGLSLGL